MLNELSIHGKLMHYLTSESVNIPYFFGYKMELFSANIPCFFGYKMELFSLQNNLKNLDPSYKMDLDIWDCLGRVKFVLKQNFIVLI